MANHDAVEKAHELICKMIESGKFPISSSMLIDENIPREMAKNIGVLLSGLIKEYESHRSQNMYDQK